jgi:acetylornithine deacetylase/succinyl-diaminopimelate desuccinylase-like protein
MKSFIDEVRAIDLLKQLVRIDSVNPSLVLGAKGEAEIAEYLSDWMRSLGLKTHLDTVTRSQRRRRREEAHAQRPHRRCRGRLHDHAAF